MAEKLPAFMFYTGDWMKDPKLSMCSPATRGIWADAICAMHDSDRSGRLSGTTEQLSRICRSTLAEMQPAIAELSATEAATVTERNGVVTLICRRMEREYKCRLVDRKRQQRHRDKRDVTPESRGRHAPSSDPSSISSSDDKPPTPDFVFGDFIPASIRTPEFMAAWSEFLKHRSEIRHALKPTSARRALLKLGKFTPEIATAALIESVEHGWQGVFPENVRTNTKGQVGNGNAKQGGDRTNNFTGARRSIPEVSAG